MGNGAREAAVSLLALFIFFFFVGSVGGWRLEVESGCGCEVDGDLKV